MLNNKRLEAILSVAASSELDCGLYILDCYIGRTIRKDYSHAITTRTATDSNTFVLEINDNLDHPNERERA